MSGTTALPGAGLVIVEVGYGIPFAWSVRVADVGGTAAEPVDATHRALAALLRIREACDRHIGAIESVLPGPLGAR